MNSEQFHQHFGESAHYWRQDPEYPRSDWKDEVWNADTLLGYWDWVLEQRAQAAESAG